MRMIITLFLTLALHVVSYAQTTTDSVKIVIESMFSAMKHADSTSLSKLFSETAQLQTITQTKEGKTVVRTESIKEFVSFVGKSHKGDADEQIQFESVLIDGELASVWTPYRFYYKGVFSHCGVNSFQLVRINNEWKIQYIIDTRRKGNCN